jgi:hypothetical protein
MSVTIRGTDNSAATPAVTGTDGDTGVFFPAANQLALATGGTQAVVVDASQNIGIGNSSPLANPSYTSVTIGGSKRGLIELKNASNAAPAYMYVSTDSDLRLETATAQAILFATNAGEKMRITSSGNVAIGAVSNDYRLHVSGGPGRFDGNTNADYQLASVPSGGADRNVFIAGVLGVSNGFQVRYLSGAMQYVMTGLASGTVSSSGGVLSASSDQNMKVADGEVESALDKVNSLKPRYFYWKDADGNANLEQGRQLGFYAQEVHSVIPEASPEPVKEHDGWGIYDRALVATLTAAIQEQQAIITDLKARIETLEKTNV